MIPDAAGRRFNLDPTHDITEAKVCSSNPGPKPASIAGHSHRKVEPSASHDHFPKVAHCLLDRRYADKTTCLADLADRAASAIGLDRSTITEALLRRESLGSTGVGGGVALPHARLASIAYPFVLLARLKKPVDFDAVDGRAVDVVCLLILPLEPSGRDLSLLARCARALRSEETIGVIRAAPTAELLKGAMQLDDIETRMNTDVQSR